MVPAGGCLAAFLATSKRLGFPVVSANKIQSQVDKFREDAFQLKADNNKKRFDDPLGKTAERKLDNALIKGRGEGR
ncbi:hypothetical protein BBJ66_02825 [Rhizobium sp. RSm-3]|nr:hypothetical protein BBJ66_02825 [Rhizobium sp. RSm-3]